jgi:hypothetical protein
VPTLAFKQPYVEPIMKGSKTQTIRLGSHHEPGDVVACHCRWGEPPFAYVEVVKVEREVRIDKLTNADARRDGFPNRKELIAAIKTFYPLAEVVTVIRFRRVQQPVESEPS